MKKIIAIVLSALALLFTGVTLAQSNNWIGTGWISSGSVVSSNNLSSNLDYLYAMKAPIPDFCDGVDQYLGWENGTWVCNGTEAPRNCVFNGNTVNSGALVTAYESAVVSSGETCASQQRSCSNGILTGSFQSSSCRVAPASACIFNGETVNHSESVLAYQARSVTAGETCQSEIRVCGDGTLSGQFLYDECRQVEPAVCVFDGREVASGQSVQAYQSDSVSFGNECISQTRTCSDGNLSGEYSAASCEVTRQDPVTYRQYDFVDRGNELRCEDVFSGRLSDRNSDNECPGLLNVAVQITTYTMENNPGFAFTSDNRSISGLGHDGIAGDPGTLSQLCQMKGYSYVVGSGGFRFFNSPNNNSLIYGFAGQRFQERTASYFNRHFDGGNGYVTCSNSPSTGGVDPIRVGESDCLQFPSYEACLVDSFIGDGSNPGVQ